MEVLYRLKANERLLLDDQEKVWVVQTGSVAVFATKVNNEMPVGDTQSVKPPAYRLTEATQNEHRRYLFSVGAGAALFGAATKIGESLSLVAVAIEATELSQISIADLVSLVATGEAEAMLQTATQALAKLTEGIALVNGWINHLSETFSTEPTAANFSHYLSLIKSINSENAASLPSILADLHSEFFDYLKKLQQQETEIAFRQFQQREQLNRQVVNSALSKLASVLQPQQETVSFQGTPLLVAAGAVGRAMGITINPPAQSEDISRVKNPVEAIARSSQIRTRRVVLEYGWWLSEYGPLLAYTQEEKRPVALLPAGKRYIFFDPLAQTRTFVNQAVAARLAPQAYQFYRPLPKVNNALALFQFGIKGYEKDIILVLVTGIIGTLLGMVVPQATALLVDNAIPDSDQSLLWQIGLALLAIAFGRSAFGMSQGILALRVENAADSALQPAIWDRLLKLSPAFFRSYSSGDLLNRTLSVNQIRRILSGATQRTLLSGLFALLNSVLMFVYSWQLALVGVGIALLTAAITAVSGLLLVRFSRRLQELDGEINGLTIQLINGVAKLRVAQAEERAFAAWANQYSQRTRLTATSQQIKDSVSVLNEILSLLTSALLFGLAVLFLQTATASGSGGFTTGTFLAFNSALGTFIGGVSNLSNTVTTILAIVPLWERAKPILQQELEYDSNKVDPGRLTGRVILDHITFRYREDGPPILNDVSLYAEPGEFVAIVGPSGSGKSTILRLLLGFETPLSGKVYYDGFDLAELDLVAVRRQFGVVLQNGRIGSGSIFENISASALISHNEAWEASRMAGFAADIEQMPMGMHTVISEGGTNLSGGQRQRLLIARALVNKPKIILMDEATSSLDNRTQAIVTESLDQLNATRIVIAHRLSTIRNADRIYVMEAGRVVQVGTFEELAEQEGLFSQLVARQME
ncbi:NHLP bacteriocin export ABC transporter permease/ATPase subunit [Brasilonema bromeliae]|uniref:NHLP bacteriocin export ABC transporter permease/ATPase subunit n=1 Tax=Brasilonema bromeliae SPC951 TaxID=385972 RepID=A0ABX1PDD4_9CYAN|nr:NHLP bacteriocin export ABC transporter permease/ATPase subunit [Brasilonema bromeliae]NMG22497.1 NHLP bacteriocin export ABC transporter permease/ATPase subunit [Brasilonema bromeliae SPC951]